MTYTIKEAIITLINRYEEKIKQTINTDKYDYFDEVYCAPKCSKRHLLNMIKTLKENIDCFPIDKSNRWLGFIQGVLASDYSIDVDEEREFSRPLFHGAYESDNRSTPNIYGELS